MSDHVSLRVYRKLNNFTDARNAVLISEPLSDEDVANLLRVDEYVELIYDANSDESNYYKLIIILIVPNSDYQQGSDHIARLNDLISKSSYYSDDTINSEVVVITKDPISKLKLPRHEERGDIYKRITPMRYHHILANPIGYALGSSYRLLPEDERDQLVEFVGHDINTYSAMRADDIISIYYNFRSGDIVEIKNIEDNGIRCSYRLVI